MKRPVTWIVRIAVAAVIAVGIGWIIRPRAIVVETAQVERGTLEATVTAEGRTRVKNLFVVAAPVDSELERIALKAGDTIAGSSVVAHIWPAAPRPLDVRSRAEALAAVSAARAAVERAEATEKEAVASLTHAESTSHTSTRLAKEGVVAPNEAEHAGHEVEIRRQAVKASGSALQEARASLVRAEAAVATSATNPTGRAVTEVRSPTAGRILRVLRESAGPVAAGTPLLDVGNVDVIEIAADFLTSDAMAVTPGAKATILDWGGSDPLSARVRQIDPGAFTKVSALGLEEQRVPIVLDLVSEPPSGFGNDFHVNVAIVVWTGRDVLTIPSTALFRTGKDWAVFVVRDGKAQLQRVIVSRSDDTRSVIERGLNAGDEIVTQPSDALRDGSRVAALATPTH